MEQETSTGRTTPEQRELEYQARRRAYAAIEDKIVEHFESQGHNKDHISIDMMPFDYKSGSNMHFTLQINDTPQPQKFHIKSVSHQESAFGTKYAELLAYKILEGYGCGPKELSAMIEFPPGFEAYQPVSRSGANLMIITQDLANLDPQHPDMHFDFKTKQVSDNTDLRYYSEAPQSVEENVQRCLITTLIELLKVRDVSDNPGNIGVQTCTDAQGRVSQKPYVIDFAIDPCPLKVEEVKDAFLKDEIPLSFFNDVASFSQSCITFTADDHIRQKTFERMFGGDKKEHKNVIKNAIDSIQERFGKHIAQGQGLRFLDRYVRDITQRFETFEQLCSQELDIRPSQSPIPEGQRLSLTQEESKAMGHEGL